MIIRNDREPDIEEISPENFFQIDYFYRMDKHEYLIPIDIEYNDNSTKRVLARKPEIETLINNEDGRFILFVSDNLKSYTLLLNRDKVKRIRILESIKQKYE